MRAGWAWIAAGRASASASRSGRNRAENRLDDDLIRAPLRPASILAKAASPHGGPLPSVSRSCRYRAARRPSAALGRRPQPRRRHGSRTRRRPARRRCPLERLRRRLVGGAIEHLAGSKMVMSASAPTSIRPLRVIAGAIASRRRAGWIVILASASVSVPSAALAHVVPEHAAEGAGAARMRDAADERDAVGGDHHVGLRQDPLHGLLAAAVDDHPAALLAVLVVGLLGEALAGGDPLQQVVAVVVLLPASRRTARTRVASSRRCRDRPRW